LPMQGRAMPALRQAPKECPRKAVNTELNLNIEQL